jgi:hypothetical protein
MGGQEGGTDFLSRAPRGARYWGAVADCFGIFPPGTPLLSLPSWHAPRVVLAKSRSPIQRWRDSAFYPATRSMAKLHRLAMRGKATFGWGKVRLAVGDRWILREFIADSLPPIGSAVLLTRPPGPAEKYTVELRDRSGTIIGYVKFATETPARRRLEQEHAMLTCLPLGLGPTPLKFGDFGEGTALLLAPLPGRPVAAKLPPAPRVVEFAKALETTTLLDLASHPYPHALREQAGAQIETILEDLAGKAWPVSLQHGDFAPWNLRWNPHANSLSAFDWEFGTIEGFPHVDLVYFVLQVAFLIYSWSPVKSAIYATKWLERESTLGITEREARALARLAMFQAYLCGKDDGYPEEHPMQAWRLRIWRGLW